MPRRFEQRWRSGLRGWWASWGESLLIAAGTIHILANSRGDYLYFLAGNTTRYKNIIFLQSALKKNTYVHT